MRLLHSRDRIFESFDGDSVPPYAILSHTWGDGEVTYQDMIAWIEEDQKIRNLRSKKGFLKIDLTCRQADHDGLDWVWIDTCNIDKTSSAELSEAINSMYQWYKNSDVCYVYLEDVSYKPPTDFELGVTYLKLQVLRSARWFTRGWTLQELIASEKIKLFCAIPGNTAWSFLGSKQSESENLATITGIDRAVLEQPELLSTTSVARRMSWAAFRETKRPEDIAYCLLGVFQVNMPLLYGEGSNAFIRLQEEILKNSEDESLFAWSEAEAKEPSQRNEGVLATHPRAFKQSSEIVPYASKLEPCAMTNRGLRIESRIVPLIDSNLSNRQSVSCILHCRYASDFEGSISIAIELDTTTGRYRRSKDKSLRSISSAGARRATTETIYIHKCGRLPTRAVRQCYLRSYPESEGVIFEKAVAMKIVYEPFTIGPVLNESLKYAPSTTKIPWNMKGRMLIAPTSKQGYYSALWFSRKTSGEQYVDNRGFLALLSLPSKIGHLKMKPPFGVFLTPLRKIPNRSELHLPLNVGFKLIKTSEHTLHLGDGIVTARLSEAHHSGEDTFVLDLISKNYSAQAVAEPQGSGAALPVIKVVDSENDETILLGDTHIPQSAPDEPGQHCGLKRQASHEDDHDRRAPSRLKP